MSGSYVDTPSGFRRSLFGRTTGRREAVGLLGAGVAAICSSAGARRAAGQATPRPQAGPAGKSTILFADDFTDGFETDGPDARWFYFMVPGANGDLLFVGDDATESTSAEGLHVAAKGVHPETGEPVFTKTVPQEDGSDSSVPGGVDHVKWLVYANRSATSGLPGFDTVPGEELVFSTRMCGQLFGTADHPFGSAVIGPDDDLRLAGAAFNTIDVETYMVYDFWLTNSAIYAFYERLPFGRQQVGNYAAFSFQIPVSTREPGEWHDLAIAYDRAGGIVRWLVDGEERFRVDRIGHRIDRQYLTIDHGGVEEDVESRQLNGGMGLFTLLDGALPSRQALVRLSAAENFYFDTMKGEPTEQTFVNDESAEESRLFGQGADLRMGHFTAESRKLADD